MSRFRVDPRATAAAVSSGLAHAFAYPNANIWPLAVVAYVPLLWWLRTDRPSPRRALGYGLLAGAVLYLVGHYWIAFTLEKMSGMPTPVAWLVLLVYALGMGLHQALWAAAVALVQGRFFVENTGKSRGPLLWVVMAAALMTSVEHLVPFLFPWYLGNALNVASGWMQVADLAGIWLVTLLCMLAGGWLLIAVTDKAARVQAIVAIALLMGAWFGYGSWRMGDVEQATVRDTVTVAMIQPNPTIAEKTSLKPRPRIPLHDRGESLTKALLADKETADSVDLVVWPEGSLPFFYVHSELPDVVGRDAKTRAPPVVKHTTMRAHRFHETIGKPLLIGALRRVDPQWRQKARNAAILLDGKTPAAIYDKKKLVPFGEYLPGTSLIPSLAGKVPGVSDMVPGTADNVMRIAGVKFGVNICYEALFADFMRTHVAAAEVLLNLTDDLWFGPSSAPEQHLMVQYPRAVELRRPLLRATATGVSTHVNAMGEVLARTGVWQKATLVQTAEVRDVDTLFRHVGLWPVRALSVACLLMVVLAWRRKDVLKPRSPR